MHDKSSQILQAKLDTAQKRVVDSYNLCLNIIAKEDDADFLATVREVYGFADRTSAAREHFASLEALIALYSARDNWIGSSGLPIAAIGPDVMTMLGNLCGYLAVGQIPEPITDVAGPGQKEPGPPERQDIRLAVTYVAAAKRGAINDRAPVKTVTERYGVNRRTVQDWSKAFDALNIEHAETITSLMDRAGRRYRQAGRSQSAIKIRSAKRRAPAN
ncbi:MAG: hypothetical protein Q8M24_14735 [Pseudolabrys sp.]|nr:hypothetical protein [Pseudolabrys sp.]MDP2296703.1 hypothetical protein [Pseudolabrys sp.]